MTEQRGTWPLWNEALTSWSVSRRSLVIGLVVGSVQIVVNQGDVWVRLQINSTLILKTLVTPMIAISVALFSSAGAYVELSRRKRPVSEPEGGSPQTATLPSGS